MEPSGKRGGADHHSVARPAWDTLCPELITKIFQNLHNRDLLRAGRCCKSWHQIVKHPQVPGLWRLVALELDKLPSHISRMWGTEGDHMSDTARYLPLCRWLNARAPGMSRLQLCTEKCWGCVVTGADECENCQDLNLTRKIQGALSMVMASIYATVDVRVDLQGSPLQWPLHRPPPQHEVIWASGLQTRNSEDPQTAGGAYTHTHGAEGLQCARHLAKADIVGTV
ncbi:hypothetical protein WJX73_001786 [Symbiochloris irregularis]|uniref:F-box domain-containing protein n=1 Tax=Symbiochloris irregularis TaxID=706552 RepID=A0AAW1PAI2_9CHLO